MRDAWWSRWLCHFVIQTSQCNAHLNAICNEYTHSPELTSARAATELERATCHSIQGPLCIAVCQTRIVILEVSQKMMCWYVLPILFFCHVMVHCFTLRLWPGQDRLRSFHHSRPCGHICDLLRIERDLLQFLPVLMGEPATKQSWRNWMSCSTY